MTLDWNAAEKNRHIAHLRGGDSEPSLICFPGSGGDINIFRDMVAALPEGHPVYGIDLEWLCDETKNFTIDQLATFYMDVVKSLRKSGPFLFCGYSFGGLLAYELASRLTREGRDVRMVALLDSPNPALTANLSTLETAQYHKRYLLDRMKRYRDHLLQGNLKAIMGRSTAFIISRTLKPLLPLIKIAARLMGTSLPTIVKSNDPGFLQAWNSYVPKPYPKDVVCFRVQDRGAEHQNDPSMGWSSCALGGVEVHVVPGGHVDMMAMPYVQVIADVLATRLRGGTAERREALAARP